VGDPLSGTQAPPIVMPNGFTYHLQELVFFCWFFGALPLPKRARKVSKM